MSIFPSPGVSPIPADLILIHPPSVFDFRQRNILFGPISDVVPSTPAFEIYPIGFSSIAEHLSRNGISVRVVNLAYLMVRYPDLDVRKYLKRLKARAFGISLHWLPHAHGAVELARLLKEIHPELPVIMGGYSATYYNEEIIGYPTVDFVVSGDSTERALLALMRTIKGKGDDFSDVPNLTYERQGGIIVNDDFIVENDLNDFSNDYLNLFRKGIKYRDIRGMTPIYDWWRYPITMMVNCRGCKHNCVICGGSNFAMRTFLKREKVAYRDPERVAQDISGISRYSTGPIFVVGDLRQAGDEYAERLLVALKDKRVKNHIVLELFEPAHEEFFVMVSETFDNFNFEISPETHDDEIRLSAGKSYTTKEMEDNIRWALKYGAEKFDVFFMIGIPGQDYRSVMDTVKYSGGLMREFGPKVVPFIAPLAPFLDPGSLGFERSDKHGYKVFFRTFEEHKKAMESPSWKYMLNYETKWLTRDEIVASTYESGKEMAGLKQKSGLIDGETYRSMIDRIDREVDLMERVDSEVRKGSDVFTSAGGIDLKELGLLCDTGEIKWPVFRSGFKFFNIAIGILRETVRRFFYSSGE